MCVKKYGRRVLQGLCMVVLVISLCSCGLTRFRYSGDGEFTDNGLPAGSDRYRLDLGNLDLSIKSTKRVLVGNLPNDTFRLDLIFTLSKELENKGPVIWSRFSTVQIRIKISRQDTGKVLYGYEGVLYKDGHRDGKYYREGLDLTEGVLEKQKYTGLTVLRYDFNDKYSLFGIETPFFKNTKRIIEIEVLEPMKDTNVELGIPPGIGVVADVVISGGGWK